jgi:hypothetical protein
MTRHHPSGSAVSPNWGRISHQRLIFRAPQDPLPDLALHNYLTDTVAIDMFIVATATFLLRVATVFLGNPQH